MTGAPSNELVPRPPGDRILHVLFLCTGNSARSIMAEALLNDLGRGRFRGFSAGSHPKGVVHPDAISTLASWGISTEGLRSKSWDEFAAPGAPRIDIVLTVCDHAARETCPVWPGKPVSAHWGVEDPAAFTGSDKARREHFLAAASLLKARICRLVTLPARDMSPQELRVALTAIGQE